MELPASTSAQGRGIRRVLHGDWKNATDGADENASGQNQCEIPLGGVLRGNGIRIRRVQS